MNKEAIEANAFFLNQFPLSHHQVLVVFFFLVFVPLLSSVSLSFFFFNFYFWFSPLDFSQYDDFFFKKLISVFCVCLLMSVFLGPPHFPLSLFLFSFFLENGKKSFLWVGKNCDEREKGWKNEWR